MNRELKPNSFYKLQASEHGIYRLLMKNRLTPWEEHKLDKIADELEKLYLHMENRVNRRQDANK